MQDQAPDLRWDDVRVFLSLSREGSLKRTGVRGRWLSERTPGAQTAEEVADAGGGCPAIMGGGGGSR